MKKTRLTDFLPTSPEAFFPLYFICLIGSGMNGFFGIILTLLFLGAMTLMIGLNFKILGEQNQPRFRRLLIQLAVLALSTSILVYITCQAAPRH